jgi:hypothetical protein
MNSATEKIPKTRLTALVDDDLVQLLDKDIIKSIEDGARCTRSSRINQIIRLHYKGQF